MLVLRFSILFYFVVNLWHWNLQIYCFWHVFKNLNFYPGLQDSGGAEVLQEAQPESDKSSFRGDMSAPAWSGAWPTSGIYSISSCNSVVGPLPSTLYASSKKVYMLMQNTILFVCLQMVNHNSYQDDPYAKEFGIKISERLASVEARVLPAPRVSGPLIMLTQSLL
jgi:hypothetical protein